MAYSFNSAPTLCEVNYDTEWYDAVYTPYRCSSLRYSSAGGASQATDVAFSLPSPSYYEYLRALYDSGISSSPKAPGYPTATAGDSSLYNVPGRCSTFTTYTTHTAPPGGTGEQRTGTSRMDHPQSYFSPLPTMQEVRRIYANEEDDLQYNEPDERLVWVDVLGKWVPESQLQLGCGKYMSFVGTAPMVEKFYNSLKEVAGGQDGMGPHLCERFENHMLKRSSQKLPPIHSDLKRNLEKKEALRKKAADLLEQRRSRKAYSTPLYTPASERRQRVRFQHSKSSFSTPVSPVDDLGQGRLQVPQEAWTDRNHGQDADGANGDSLDGSRSRVNGEEDGGVTDPDSSSTAEVGGQGGRPGMLGGDADAADGLHFLPPVGSNMGKQKEENEAAKKIKGKGAGTKLTTSQQPKTPAGQGKTGANKSKGGKRTGKGGKHGAESKITSLPTVEVHEDPALSLSVSKGDRDGQQEDSDTKTRQRRQIVKKERVERKRVIIEPPPKALSPPLIETEKRKSWIYGNEDYSEPLTETAVGQTLVIEAPPLPENIETSEAAEKQHRKIKKTPLEVKLDENRKKARPTKKLGSYDDERRRQELAEERRKRLQREMMKGKKQKNSEDGSEDGEVHFDDYGFLAKYCIFNKGNLEMYRQAFDTVDDDGRGWLPGSDVMIALRGVNNKLSGVEENYLYRILELTGYKVCRGADFQLFSVLAALSQRIASLDNWMKNIIGNMNFKMLEMKMFMCKTLWECNVDPETNKISIDQLCVELRAGGVSFEHECEVRDKLGHLKALDLLDFLTYVPLFIMIHESVVENPLDDTRQK